MSNSNKKIFTVPNVLSMFRIVLIPFIAWTYFNEKMEYHYLVSLSLLFLSGATDVIDGFVARHFDMVSDVGKILDPIADKLTQFTVVICLAVNIPMMSVVAIIIFAKELLMLIGAVVLIKNGCETPYARWWGKLTTVVLYATMLMFILSEFMNGFFGTVLPEWAATTAISACIACLAFSFLNYLLIFIDGKKEKNTDPIDNKNLPVDKKD